MGRKIAEIIAGRPKKRRERIERKAREMAGEMVSYAASLRDVRKAASKTQSEIGARLGMPQSAISQLEKRSDLLVSTLAKYATAVGGALELVVRMKDGSEIVLEKRGTTAVAQRRSSVVRGRMASKRERKAA